MELKLLHFYPDLMSLYGSYANVAVLRRHLEDLGNAVTAETILPGQDADVAGADFVFMGAGTERSQKAALADFARFGPAVQRAADSDMAMLFAGTAMELLGSEITDDAGSRYPGIALADFTAVQGRKRLVGDVYGTTELIPQAVVGFMNKCAVISGVETPLLSGCGLGFGNEREGGPEGFRYRSVLGSELTGPILVKNPRLLDWVIAAIYQRRGESLPESRPVYPYEEDGYQVTSEQLKLRCTREG